MECKLCKGSEILFQDDIPTECPECALQKIILESKRPGLTQKERKKIKQHIQAYQNIIRALQREGRKKNAQKAIRGSLETGERLSLLRLTTLENEFYRK